MKFGVNTLVENNVSGFKNISLTHLKQPPNLKRILTNILFTNKIVGVFICSDSRCLCCQQLLLETSYAFENVGKQFFFKKEMMPDSRNLIYVVICPSTLVKPELSTTNSEGQGQDIQGTYSTAST